MVERIRPSEEPTAIEPRRRGRPFEKGNPGRPPGSKNKLTRVLEELVEHEGENLTRTAIQLGLKGNVQCLQYLLDRILPKRRGRPLDFQLPKINGVHDIASAMATIANGVSDGDLTPEEGTQLMGFLESQARVIVANDLVGRTEMVEAQMKQFKTFKR